MKTKNLIEFVIEDAMMHSTQKWFTGKELFEHQHKALVLTSKDKEIFNEILKKYKIELSDKVLFVFGRVSSDNLKDRTILNYNEWYRIFIAHPCSPWIDIKKSKAWKSLNKELDKVFKGKHKIEIAFCRNYFYSRLSNYFREKYRPKICRIYRRKNKNDVFEYTLK